MPSLSNVIIALVLARVMKVSKNPLIPAVVYTLNVLVFGFAFGTAGDVLLTKTLVSLAGSYAVYWILKKVQYTSIFWPVAIVGAIALGYI